MKNNKVLKALFSNDPGIGWYRAEYKKYGLRLMIGSCPMVIMAVVVVAVFPRLGVAENIIDAVYGVMLIIAFSMLVAGFTLGMVDVHERKLAGKEVEKTK